MTKRKDKEKVQAIKMRLTGASYSQIRSKINVSKSTLSTWLRNYPLPEKRIRELRDNNPKRIERFRNTMRIKREGKQKIQYERAKKDIGTLSKHERFLAGLFLYWGEGTKTKEAEVSLSNTDLAMIRFFIHWLENLGIKKSNLRIRLHLYSDMNTSAEECYWSQALSIPLRQFRKPYIKKTRRCDISWKNPSEHGTCNVLFGSKEMHDYVIMAVKRLQEISDRL